MVFDSDLVLYACVAKSTTILAEFNSTDADLGTLAAKCLQQTPPFHTTFSHTVRNKTYTFLIDHRFVYFAIFDHDLHNSEGLSFLRTVKDAFADIVESNDTILLNNLDEFCYQGKFNPVFHSLLAPESPISDSLRDDLRNGNGGNLDSFNMKKIRVKKRLVMENNDGDEEGNGLSLNDEKLGTGVRSREFSTFMERNGLLGVDSGHQKAKRVWKKHVWVVLSLDLIVCCILFGVWLWVCRGLKCVGG